MNKRQRHKVAVSIVTKLGLRFHEKREVSFTRQEKKLYKQHRWIFNYTAMVAIQELKEEGKL